MGENNIKMSKRIKVALVRMTCISELFRNAVGAVRFRWMWRKWWFSSSNVVLDV